MSEQRGTSPWLWVRIALVAFVLTWLLGPSELRNTVPILPVFLVALGLELHFLVSALRGGPRESPDRGPQEVDRNRYGFELDPEDILVADTGCEEVRLSERIEVDLSRSQPAADEPPAPASQPFLAPARRFLLGLGMIAALFAILWFVESRTGWESLDRETRARAVARYSAESSRIAKKPVSIRCDEARDYVGAVQHSDGVAVVGGELAILTPEICHDLYRLAVEREVLGSRTGRALAVLAHETWHLRGVVDEGTTECYAIQTGVALGIRLGLAEDTARRLMRQQLTENSLRGAASLDYRVARDCREGGRLDLDPGDSRFP